MTTSRIPDGIGPLRRRILEVGLHELDLGVHEVPWGSNRGPRVDVYLPKWARKRPGPPWCAWFVTWVLEQALGEVPTGARRGGCEMLRSDAIRTQLWCPKGDVAPGELRPIPGDLFWMDTDGNTGNKGHVGIVLRVSEDFSEISTIEGNSGQGVRLGHRVLSDPRIRGFINTVRSEPNADFELGLGVKGEDVGAKSTR